jgi:serine/threonine protein kinase
VIIDANGDIHLSGCHQLKSLEEHGQVKESIFGYYGEPEWMSPEIMSQVCKWVYRNCPYIDPLPKQSFKHSQKTDIYSLGITALELFHGATPFHEWPGLKVRIT